MEELLKKLYDDADIDFLIDESIALTNIEFKQTFNEYNRAAEYTYNLLKSRGIDSDFLTFPADGKTTYHDFRMPIAWKATKGRLTVTKSEIAFEEPVIADYERHPFHLIKGSTATPEGGIKARLFTEEQMQSGADVTGGIVLIPPHKFARSASISPILDRGAVGFISSCVGHGMAKETPDELAWCNAATDDHAHWHVQSEDRPFVGFSITPRTGEKLYEACEKGEVEVLIESDGCRYDGELNAVCGYVKGKSEKEIWLIAHLYEPFIVDNCLSVMTAIEIARQIKKMGTPNFSVRLVFAAETYGLPPVWEHYKDKVAGKVLGAIDIDAPPAMTYDKNFTSRFNPYCSPFFGNYLFLACAKAYEKAFPSTEKCASICIEYGDDLILGDPTIGVPTLYFEEKDCFHWHSTFWDPKYLDRDKVRRSYALAAAWSVSIAFADEASVLKYLPECVEIAQTRLDGFAKEDNSRNRMEYFLAGERAQIMDFSRLIDSPEIEKAAKGLHISPDDEKNATIPSLDRVKNVIPSRACEGFPYDLIKIPYNERKPLPNGMIYGAFGTIIAKMDGKKPLSEIILEAAWEHKLAGSDADPRLNHFRPLSEELINDYIDAVYYLADAGYLIIA